MFLKTLFLENFRELKLKDKVFHQTKMVTSNTSGGARSKGGARKKRFSLVVRKNSKGGAKNVPAAEIKAAAKPLIAQKDIDTKGVASPPSLTHHAAAPNKSAPSSPAPPVPAKDLLSQPSSGAGGKSSGAGGKAAATTPKSLAVIAPFLTEVRLLETSADIIQGVTVGFGTVYCLSLSLRSLLARNRNVADLCV